MESQDERPLGDQLREAHVLASRFGELERRGGHADLQDLVDARHGRIVGARQHQVNLRDSRQLAEEAVPRRRGARDTRIVRVVLLAYLLLPGCGFESHPGILDAGGGSDAGSGCVDPDQDGFGDGQACLGPDCREDDPTLHECLCDADGVGTGCPCAPTTDPAACYDGPPGTAGVGLCVAGLRRCEGGRWTDCVGQVVPLPAETACDYEDEDCDGVADDGVTFECGTCDASCSLLRYGIAGQPFPVDGNPAPIVREDGSISIGAGGPDLRAVVTIRPPGVDPGGYCGRWGPVDLSASVPEGASVLVEVRGGWSADNLQGAPWFRVLALPEGAPPADLPDAVREEPLVELRLTLLARDAGRLPTVDWLTLQRTDPGCGFE